MNRKIIQKVIDELKQDKPKIDYVLGVLETLIESLPEDTKTNTGVSTGLAIKPKVSEPVDEGILLDAKARAAIETIKNLTAVSEETNVVKN